MKSHDLNSNYKKLEFNEYCHLYSLDSLAKRIQSFGDKEKINGIKKSTLQEKYNRAKEISDTITYNELLLIWFARESALVSQITNALQDRYKADQTLDNIILQNKRRNYHVKENV